MIDGQTCLTCRFSRKGEGEDFEMGGTSGGCEGSSSIVLRCHGNPPMPVFVNGSYNYKIYTSFPIVGILDQIGNESEWRGLQWCRRWAEKL